MGVEIPRGGTEYVGDPVTIGRGTVADITAVKSFHSTDPTVKPLVAQFTDAAALVSSEADPLWAGTVEIVTRIGPRGEVALTPGDWQRWVCITTADEDIIVATGTVTIT